MRDPIEEDDGEWEARRDEEARELRWQTFVEVVLVFAETENWPGVLAAVARAMRESESELMAQREAR